MIGRTAAAALAGVALAAVATNPASAYWRATGSGSGTVTTSTGATKVITVALSSGTGRSIKATGAAGLSPTYNPAVTVTLCKVNSWPCPAASVAATLTATATAGTPSYTASSGNLNGVTVWGQASQLETSGWRDYSTIAGPITG
jgi:hypothetical protein